MYTVFYTVYNMECIIEYLQTYTHHVFMIFCLCFAIVLCIYVHSDNCQNFAATLSSSPCKILTCKCVCVGGILLVKGTVVFYCLCKDVLSIGLL